MRNLSIADIKELNDEVLTLSELKELEQNQLVTLIKLIDVLEDSTEDKYGYTIDTHLLAFEIYGGTSLLATVEVRGLKTIEE